jgi:flagellar biogenesis protein FliO
MENITVPQISEEPKSLAESLLLRVRALFSTVKISRRPRRLRLGETVSLGDKRIVAVIEYENQRFLVAATAQNISLLQTLDAAKDEDEKSEL